MIKLTIGNGSTFVGPKISANGNLCIFLTNNSLASSYSNGDRISEQDLLVLKSEEPEVCIEFINLEKGLEFYASLFNQDTTEKQQKLRVAHAMHTLTTCT